MRDVRHQQAQEDTGMWRRSKAKSAKRLASLGLLQDAMGRVEQEQDRAAASAGDQQVLQHQVPSQQRLPREQHKLPREQQPLPREREQEDTARETSATGTGGAGW
jgi:hypothetical protein